MSDGKDRISNVLDWAFGAGKVGQTFLFERNGATYEARASYFDGKRALDVTPGRALDSPVDLEAAIGRRLPLGETRRCFACHSTTLTIRDALVRDIVPGVTCEACHGPGRAHGDAIQEDRVNEGRAAILNPAMFNAIDSVDFCGACHGTYWDVTLAGRRVSRRCSHSRSGCRAAGAGAKGTGASPAWPVTVRINRWNGSRSPTTADACSAIARSGAVP